MTENERRQISNLRSICNSAAWLAVALEMGYAGRSYVVDARRILLRQLREHRFLDEYTGASGRLELPSPNHD